jgi:hypothetical protein
MRVVTMTNECEARIAVGAGAVDEREGCSRAPEASASEASSARRPGVSEQSAGDYKSFDQWRIGWLDDRKIDDCN